MILVADIGNSYLKMARWDGERLSQTMRVRHRDLLGPDWQDSLGTEAPWQCDGVYIASVADQGVEEVFESWLLSCGHERPVYLKSEREACGVTNAYSEPETLGVDRWCAMIAARAQCQGHLCVVDAGTAMTVDWVNDEGLHLGGIIMPGPTLQSDSLFGGTRHVQAGTGTPDHLFADNTVDAVVSGICFSGAALVELAVGHAAKSAGSVPRLFLTGGEAERIMPLLQTPALMQQDLVLQGVACLAARAKSAG